MMHSTVQYCTVQYSSTTYTTVLYSTVIWIVVSYSYYVLYSTIPGHVYRIAHMATPAPRCSCCYAQRKSRGPEGHCDGNFLVLLLRDACFRLPHCRPAHSCRPSKVQYSTEGMRACEVKNAPFDISHRLDSTGQVFPFAGYTPLERSLCS